MIHDRPIAFDAAVHKAFARCNMYTLAVSRPLEASHFLVGGDWGAENTLHPHPYRIEVRFAGHDLDPHGYLLDITVVEERFAELIGDLQGRVLNALPEFSGLNPSIEHLARIVWTRFRDLARRAGMVQLSVTVWEGENAWAAFTERP
jgi:6-pyruvoyltetrahydropterin/6-carboxytetrahydropterin synthase